MNPGWLAAGAAALAGAGIVGVQLGQSAISEVNPIHFQGPLERPKAITPPPEPAPYDPYAQTYNWTMGAGETEAMACELDCDGSQAREAMRLALAGQDGAPAPALPAWRDATPQTELRPWPPGTVPGRGLSVERYLHYPVNQEQAARAGQRSAEPAAETPAPAAQDQ